MDEPDNKSKSKPEKPEKPESKPEPDDDKPEWVKELENKVLKIYSELLATSVRRNKHHKQATDALNRAINTTQRLTLDFLEQIKFLNTKD